MAYYKVYSFIKMQLNPLQAKWPRRGAGAYLRLL